MRRDTQTLELSGTLVERPREAASDKYRVEYAHVDAVRGRQRTLLSTPLPGVAGQRHPALLFVQGVTLSSIDQPLTDTNAYSRIVAAFANSGFVTMRVEKPGVGDSEGSPATTVDFEQELDGYRQALKALRARPDVDPSRIFIFGHSMGGLWAPLLASEAPIRGIAVAGTGFRTWIEYALENTRRQSLLGGATAAAVHDEITRLAPLLTGFFAQRLTPAQLRERHQVPRICWTICSKPATPCMRAVRCTSGTRSTHSTCPRPGPRLMPTARRRCLRCGVSTTFSSTAWTTVCWPTISTASEPTVRRR